MSRLRKVRRGTVIGSCSAVVDRDQRAPIGRLACILNPVVAAGLQDECELEAAEKTGDPVKFLEEAFLHGFLLTSGTEPFDAFKGEKPSGSAEWDIASVRIAKNLAQLAEGALVPLAGRLVGQTVKRRCFLQGEPADGHVDDEGGVASEDPPQPVQHQGVHLTSLDLTWWPEA